MSVYIVSVDLVFNNSSYFLWTTATLNELGQNVRLGAAFRDVLSNRVHLVGRKSRETLCGRFRMVEPVSLRKPSKAWDREQFALSMTTAVEKQGTASFYAATGVTFLRLCERCMRASEHVHLAMNFSKDPNNQWNTVCREVELASSCDFDKWRRFGLNV